ncbi:hypothetical protein MKK70_26090 [Methylobacterium sp. E-041]|jgi:hypothetical protein|uniref:hypothetical protein n=1 Tax=unclassified Methylobacterium TaxID=2615210 RepID=UPI001650ABFD|nr:MULTISPECIES: hypothetical protein [unclassified Methylobacterium]MCJ2010197.1 hypothetical protein [Methylobacterium sp. J-092]MCJ2038277.1 hypothetical protein [Methylobacterium sp. J-059]MCJ2078604.1 hypothetical protein [Methylobacterium sp. E-016]MCJ2108782.1 hypothetical protein [Methylobacterium sp. E-041]MCJ2110782.1 hypothetical protein [Methylobacterium sp. E-025]
MAQPTFPDRPGHGANSVEHRIGQDVDGVDQLSSVVLMGLAIGGAALALILVHFLIG